MTKYVKVHCNGHNETKGIKKEPDTITFETKGDCNFTSFNFTGGPGNPYYPQGFSNRNPSNGAGKSVSYDYDATAIPESGYTFEYVTDSSPRLGNGSGTIKND